jgi:AIPR protein
MEVAVYAKPKYEEILAEIEYIQEKLHVKQDYHAFAYWFIATLYGKGEKEIKSAFCDGTHDKGIDAILIDKVERTVSVFQSKFEHEGNKTQLKENEVKLLAVVREYFGSRKALTAATSKANPATQRLADEAYNSVSDGYSLELVFITTHKSNPAIDPLLRDTFHFTQDQFRVFCYDNMLAVMAEKRRDFLPMNAPYNLPFISADSTIVKTGEFNSWVITVKANDLRDMAINYPDHLLFRKNVRDFISVSETNKRMMDTLKDPAEQRHFWFYNNGITILCESASLNMEKKYIHLNDPEVINGAQTVTAIRKFKDDSEAEVLVRIVSSQDQKFMDSMILYQNSSNQVKKRDLKSNDPVQVRLHHEFLKRGWYYEIKRGQDYETRAKEDRNIRDQIIFQGISNSAVAKVLAAVELHPYVAASKGDDYFFGEAYEDIFTSDISTFNCLAPWMLADLIYRSYDNEKFHGFEKAWLFKNPATYFVLKALYEPMSKSSKMQMNWVSFWENNEYDSKSWVSFEKKMRKIFGELFEVAYDGWNKAQEKSEIDYNGYFKSKDEVDKILGRKDTAALVKQAVQVFEEKLPA